MTHIISIEGGEFTGKTTIVIPGLAQEFKNLGYDVLTSREPGGTPDGEALRKEIFNKIIHGISPLEQAQLFNKARKIHIDQVILPFIEKKTFSKKIVILDRYLDSTRVYQGLEGKVDMPHIFKLEKEHVGNIFPSLTLILYIPKDHFEKIIKERQLKTHSNRLDQTTFHNNDIETYLARQQNYLTLPLIAKQNGENRHFVQINSAQTPKKVVSDCIKAIKTSLPGLFSI